MRIGHTFVSKAECSNAVRVSRPHRVQRSAVVSSSSGVDDLSIRVRNLTVSLGPARRQVLKGVNLSIRRGSLHMILGPNGCGKSTLLRVLGGLLDHEQGSVAVEGPVGFVFQNPDHQVSGTRAGPPACPVSHSSLLPQVIMPSVAADVAFGLGKLQLGEDEVGRCCLISTSGCRPAHAHLALQVRRRVEESLAAVGLGDLMDRPTHNLSGGQKQRVAIAGALAERPRVLLLDELTTFLDESDQTNVLRAIRQVVDADRAVTAVLVTHR